MATIRQMVTRTHRVKLEHLPDASREAYRAAAEYWHKEILPKHFTAAGAAEYGYAPRGAKYERRKKRITAQSQPLVFSGRMKRDVLRVRDIRVKGGMGMRGGRANIVLHGPPYMGYRGRGKRHRLRMEQELQAISTQDAQALAQVVGEHVTAQLNQPAAPERIQ